MSNRRGKSFTSAQVRPNALSVQSPALFVEIVGVSDALLGCRAFVGHCRNVGCRVFGRAFVGRLRRLSLLTVRLRPCYYARPLVGMSECPPLGSGAAAVSVTHIPESNHRWGERG